MSHEFDGCECKDSWGTQCRGLEYYRRGPIMTRPKVFSKARCPTVIEVLVCLLRTDLTRISRQLMAALRDGKNPWAPSGFRKHTPSSYFFLAFDRITPICPTYGLSTSPLPLYVFMRVLPTFSSPFRLRFALGFYMGILFSGRNYALFDTQPPLHGRWKPNTTTRSLRRNQKYS